MAIPTHCIFCTKTNRLIDFVPEGTDGATLVAKFTPDYGNDLVVMLTDDAWQRHENSFKSAPIEITEERWHEMLGVLPPIAWKSDPSGESFKISEMTAGSITAIFVRIRDRYFEFSDTVRLPHRECVARVLAAFFPKE